MTFHALPGWTGLGEIIVHRTRRSAFIGSCPGVVKFISIGYTGQTVAGRTFAGQTVVCATGTHVSVGVSEVPIIAGERTGAVGGGPESAVSTGLTEGGTCVTFGAVIVAELADGISIFVVILVALVSTCVSD